MSNAEIVFFFCLPLAGGVIAAVLFNLSTSNKSRPRPHEDMDGMEINRRAASKEWGADR